MPIYNPAAAGGGGGGGSLTGNIVSKTANYTAATDDDVILCSGTFTVTLYAASGNSGNLLFIKNNNTGTITIDANGSELIDGNLSVYSLTKYTSYELLCDGTGWSIL